jgi:hypothetical protein
MRSQTAAQPNLCGCGSTMKPSPIYGKRAGGAPPAHAFLIGSPAIAACPSFSRCGSVAQHTAELAEFGFHRDSQSTNFVALPAKIFLLRVWKDNSHTHNTFSHRSGEPCIVRTFLIGQTQQKVRQFWTPSHDAHLCSRFEKLRRGDRHRADG